MKKYSLAGSVFVIGSRLWSKNYISVPQLLEMQKHGWEIGYHSWSHNNRWVLNQDEYERETDCKVLKEQGLKMTTFCFPHSAYNRRIINYLRTKTDFKTLLGIPSKDADSMKGPRPSNNMYKSYSFNQFTTFKNLKDRLLHAVLNDEYLIFMIHKISPTPGQKGEISLNLFEQFCQMLKELEDMKIIKVLPLRDAHRLLPRK